MGSPITPITTTGTILILGRVTSGEGGDAILAKAERVLREEFPELAGRIRLHIPSEQEKRHGQAMAAASLPAIPETGAERCSFHNPGAELVRAGWPAVAAELARTTHLCSRAPGRSRNHGRAAGPSVQPAGPVVHRRRRDRRRGSPRAGLYQDYTDEQMR